ncbi:hypothetical protein protein [Bacillus cereus G9241]|nr:hypothetical protein protein [Bacillus cereus G9241]
MYQTGMIQQKLKFQAQDLLLLYGFLNQTIGSESLSKIHDSTQKLQKILF